VTAPVTVSGGAASIAADCDDLLTTASIVGATADNLMWRALALHADLSDGVGPAALLDPVGALRFEMALLAALDGPSGLAPVLARITATQLALRAAADAYLAVDRLRVDLLPYLDASRNVTPAQISAIRDLLSGRWSAAFEDSITENPYLLDIVVAQLGGPGTYAALGAQYPDGEPVLTPTGVDISVAAGPPRSLRDVIGNLARRNAGDHGEIDVQILTGTDAAGVPYRKVIVDIPGTKDWNATQRTDRDVTNFGTNCRALAGEQTTYEKGVLAALDAAGVQPGDDITLVGHSLGGVIAVNTARDLTAEGRNVSHVITAGAPISSVAEKLPRSVQVLAVENRGDIVPHLDGALNPDVGSITTVTIEHDQHDVLANHDLDGSYLPGAADIDASDDPSVRSYLDGLSDQLNASTSTTYTYVITRSV